MRKKRLNEIVRTAIELLEDKEYRHEMVIIMLDLTEEEYQKLTR